MTELDIQLFEEYFQLQHYVNVNITFGGDYNTLPDEASFEQSIPVPYKIASEMKGLEQTMLRPLRQLGDVIEPLADYLKAQSRKIDLMMSYILQAEDDSGDQYQTKSYGGGGFTFETERPMPTDQWYTCKLFFDDEATAVFCLAKLAKSEALLPLPEAQAQAQAQDNEQDRIKENTQDDPKRFLNTMVFCRIRDEDRESVVRASLHQQSKQLLKKTQSKN